MRIRTANLNDIPALAYLMGELGYPTSLEDMKERYHNISNNPNCHTLVAEYEGSIAGMVGMSSSYSYENNGRYLRIVAFVVDSKYRNKGIGKALNQETEIWAIEKGFVAIALNSGNRIERQDAHRFYRSLGYVEKCIGFLKKLK